MHSDDMLEPSERLTCPIWTAKVCYATPDQASLVLRRMFYDGRYADGLEIYTCPYGAVEHLHLGNRREQTQRP